MDMMSALSAVEHTAWPLYVTVSVCALGEGAFLNTAAKEKAVPFVEHRSIDDE